MEAAKSYSQKRKEAWESDKKKRQQQQAQEMASASAEADVGMYPSKPCHCGGGRTEVHTTDANASASASASDASALLHVLLYGMCPRLSGVVAPLPSLASLSPLCAYAVVLACTRRCPRVHFQECRTWTLLAVATVTPLVTEHSGHLPQAAASSRRGHARRKKRQCRWTTHDSVQHCRQEMHWQPPTDVRRLAFQRRWQGEIASGAGMYGYPH